jgi:hypothetical protein
LSAEAFEIAQAVILSLGGGGLIIFELSSFLAKVWAKRILLSEKSEHDKDIAEFKGQLEALAEKKSINYQQKLDLLLDDNKNGRLSPTRLAGFLIM